MSVHKPKEKEIRKAAAWKYFAYNNNQYNHALKQMEMLGHSQKLFFEDFLGEQRKLKAQDELIAISKKEWLQFRSEFYDAQKLHLNEMKVLINDHQTKQAVLNPCSHKLHERTKAEEVSASTKTVTIVSQDLSNQIISGSIVGFVCGEGNTKKSIKALLGDVGVVNEVAYIDFKDFGLSGFLRFKSKESATGFVDGDCPGLDSVGILSPAQEREYTERISQDKEIKRESQKRKNQRIKSKSSDNAKKMKIE